MNKLYFTINLTACVVAGNIFGTFTPVLAYESHEHPFSNIPAKLECNWNGCHNIKETNQDKANEACRSDADLMLLINRLLLSQIHPAISAIATPIYFRNERMIEVPITTQLLSDSYHIWAQLEKNECVINVPFDQTRLNIAW
jgi:hypothetical protein